MICIEVHDFDGWRVLARKLIQRAIKPCDIAWEVDQQGVFFADDVNIDDIPIVIAAPKIPRDFIDMAFYVACYRDPSRWALLYSLLWRLVFENKYLLNNAIDDQVAKANKMRKTIARDKHKMEAFVRFQCIDLTELYRQKNNIIHSDADVNASSVSLSQDNPIAKQQEYYIAWFEPEHLILPVTLPFFVKRFSNMYWSILTPDTCVHWDLEKITITQGLAKGPKIDDSIESLWLEYYKNIFNPARLKIKAMQSEMPKKYWQHLPEAKLIKDLIRNAQQRTESMIESEATEVNPKNKKSKFIQNKQGELRVNRERS